MNDQEDDRIASCSKSSEIINPAMTSDDVLDANLTCVDLRSKEAASDGVRSAPASETSTSSSVVITSLPDSLFCDPSMKSTFERMFSRWDADARFTYWRSFRRVVIRYSSAEGATCARRYHSQTDIHGTMAKCYMLQEGRASTASTVTAAAASTSCCDDTGHLRPPAASRLFLISPPASPPLDWRPVAEADPVPNYDLLTAVWSLAPGESHEVHKGERGQPSIVVHVATGEPAGDLSGRPPPPPPLKIVQTRRPTR